MPNGKTPTKGQGYLHQGHRKRMLKRLRFDQSLTVYDHEVLEILLFYVIPRANTNPTAHELLFKFKTIKKVLNADPDELLEVRGVGKESVTFLRLLGKIFNELDDLPTPLAVGRSRFELDGVLDARFYKDEAGEYNVVIVNLNGGIRSIVPFKDDQDFMEVGKKIFRMLGAHPTGVVFVHTRARGHKFTDDDEDMIMTYFVAMANLALVKTFNYLVYDRGIQKYNYYHSNEKRKLFNKALKLDFIKEMNKEDERIQKEKEELKKKNFDYFEDTETSSKYPKIGDTFEVKKKDDKKD